MTLYAHAVTADGYGTHEIIILPDGYDLGTDEGMVARYDLPADAVAQVLFDVLTDNGWNWLGAWEPTSYGGVVPVEQVD